MKANKVIENVCKKEHYCTGIFEMLEFKHGEKWYKIILNVYSDNELLYFIAECVNGKSVKIDGSSTRYAKALYNYMASVFGFDEIEVFGNNVYKLGMLFGE